MANFRMAIGLVDEYSVLLKLPAIFFSFILNLVIPTLQTNHYFSYFNR